MSKEHVEERDGGLYVAGTRVSLDSIVQCFQEGMSAEAILGEFETLTLAQVYGYSVLSLHHPPTPMGRMRVRCLVRSTVTSAPASRCERADSLALATAGPIAGGSTS